MSEVVGEVREMLHNAVSEDVWPMAAAFFDRGVGLGRLLNRLEDGQRNNGVMFTSGECTDLLRHVEYLMGICQETVRPSIGTNVPIAELHLSVRLHNCLLNAKIYTLGDLLQKTEADLLVCKNFGERCLAETGAVLAQRGMALLGAVDAPSPAAKESDV